MTLATNIAAANQGTTAAKTVNPNNSGLTNSLESLASNFTNFISLLTTQLKNQDPTDPMETNEFTQELIGFSEVQQSLETNTNLKSLLAATNAASINNSISYVNQLIEADTDTINQKTGKPLPEMSYTLPQNTKTTAINITDAAGNIVKTFVGDVSAGKHKLTWDGKNNAGNSVTDGNYKIKISALDADGKEIEGSTTTVTDYVSQVDFVNGVSTLYFGDVAFTADKIKSVKGYFAQDQLPVGEDPSA